MTDSIIKQTRQTATFPLALTDKYRVMVSQDLHDPVWDAFLTEAPGGHHVQTSLWAQVKAALGWQVVRLRITRGDQIVAGAQILLRRLPVWGCVGFLPKGPVLADDDPALVELLIAEIQRLARKKRILHLTVQPTDSAERMEPSLRSAGFQPTAVALAPTATLLLDLNQDLDMILAGMSTSTRYNVRLGARKGLTFREGSAADLETYYQILSATAQRQQFYSYPQAYYQEMWRIMHPVGYCRLFLVEQDGEVVSAQLAVPFGDTVINKLSVWNGRFGKIRPNESLQWGVIQWAKAQGYRYYDFEGIKPAAAQAILRQEPLPDSINQTVTSFKLGFGGEVALYSGAYDYLYNPLFRWTYRELFPKVKNHRLVKRRLKQMRTG